MSTFSIIFHLYLFIYYFSISDVIIRIRLEFVTLGPKPSESKVLRLIHSLLASNLTTKQITKTAVIPNEPVVKTGVTYSSEFFSLLHVLFLCV